jgi:hypothetical protein
MSDPLKVYSPGQVALTLGGLDVSQGMADGDFFTCEPASEAHTSKVGADGSVAIAQNLDPRANAKIVTLQTSSANAILGALMARGAVVPFEMRDLATGSLIVTSPTAKVKKWPATARGKEVGQLEWEIELFAATWTHGATAAVS